jgi:hypothetical protein
MNLEKYRIPLSACLYRIPLSGCLSAALTLVAALLVHPAEDPAPDVCFGCAPAALVNVLPAAEAAGGFLVNGELLLGQPPPPGESGAPGPVLPLLTVLREHTTPWAGGAKELTRIGIQARRGRYALILAASWESHPDEPDPFDLVIRPGVPFEEGATARLLLVHDGDQVRFAWRLGDELFRGRVRSERPLRLLLPDHVLVTGAGHPRSASKRWDRVLGAGSELEQLLRGWSMRFHVELRAVTTSRRRGDCDGLPAWACSGEAWP